MADRADKITAPTMIKNIIDSNYRFAITSEWHNSCKDISAIALHHIYEAIAIETGIDGIPWREHVINQQSII
jgi:hypothetical protein